MDAYLSEEGLDNIKQFLMTEGLDWGLNILAALAIFVIGRWLARRVVGLGRRAMRKAKVDATLSSFISNILYVLLIGFVLIAALSKLGVETTSLAAIFAAAGLAIGLALQGSLANLAAGVMIIVFRPLKAGDYVEAGGVAGTVEDVDIFTTTLATPDNREVIVPNGSIISGTITNYSARATRRLDIVVGISYSDDIRHAKRVLQEILDEEKRLLSEPAPVIAVSELAESSINLVVRPWVKTPEYWDIRFDLLERIKQRFDEEGISIPFPQRQVHVYSHGDDKGSGLEAA